MSFIKSPSTPGASDSPQTIKLKMFKPRSAANIEAEREAEKPEPESLLKGTYVCKVSSSGEEGDEVPMFLAMAKCVITPTGFFDNSKRDELLKKVEMMCGEISYAFTSKTTHIVTGHGHTSKVGLGRLKRVPVVSKEWIESIWTHCTEGGNPYVHVSHPQFQEYGCPIFYNLRLMFSNYIPAKLRKQHEKIAVANGATLVDKVKKSPKYFYIGLDPISDRFVAVAVASKVPCVSLDWITESIAQQRLPKTAEFSIIKQKEPQASTGSLASDDLGNEGGGVTNNMNLENDVFEDATITPSVPPPPRRLRASDRRRSALFEPLVDSTLEAEESDYDSDSTLNASSMSLDDDDDEVDTNVTLSTTSLKG